MEKSAIGDSALVMLGELTKYYMQDRYNPGQSVTCPGNLFPSSALDLYS